MVLPLLAPVLLPLLAPALLPLLEPALLPLLIPVLLPLLAPVLLPCSCTMMPAGGVSGCRGLGGPAPSRLLRPAGEAAPGLLLLLPPLLLLLVLAKLLLCRLSAAACTGGEGGLRQMGEWRSVRRAEAWPPPHL